MKKINYKLELNYGYGLSINKFKFKFIFTIKERCTVLHLIKFIHLFDF